MAYANLAMISCADKKEAFARMRDFICKRNGTYDYSSTGIGWTLHDSSYAVDEDNPQVNDWIVVYSVGENGTDDIYVKLTWTSNLITAKLHQSWDSSTHAGSTNAAGTSSNWTVTDAMDSGDPFGIYGDLNLICGVFAYSSTVYRSVVFGKVIPNYEWQTDLSYTVSAALTAGSDVVITPSSIPSNWAIGIDVYIRTTHDDAMGTVEIEKARITAITGSTITVDLVNSYTADSKVSDHIGYICGNNAQFAYANGLIIPDGSINQALLIAYNSGFVFTNHDPESASDLIGVYKILYNDTVGTLGHTPNVARTPTHNATFTHLDLLKEPDGTFWRCFNVYSAIYLAVREV